MRLLALETSTEACSVALWLDGEVRERFQVAPRRHAELVLPWADALLAEAGIARASLDGIAVSRGPGAFTGVRLGISLAQGIALALDLPALAVSTLAVLAQGARVPEAGLADTRVLAAIDARMGEVYLGGFARVGDGWRALVPEAVVAPDAATLPGDATDGGWIGVGTGFAALDGALRTRLGARLGVVDDAALPRAGDLARMAAAAFARGEAVAPDLLEPAYLRNNVALTVAEQAASRQRD
ncbi:tRNA (adenosine(37)-N6)-threonylcarbamoyltransferase complex dimerization subunit type 1 TsaB [Luteimonas sp. MC1825]|uniref:tRNA (adenosine(37)-N6)-threonylcarbamoyltransferase complex dimerization subunit type 1 TsaB n=1 Tax=Luteimonas sp. MC1825 TaxID=2761107 RepID=UPI00161FEAFF|nr:tRNA (adenosine(37)-N6)-threonylcarbamoyltransferase complex dimerization subunit type 1 TsaB [Luteimonas sp. MC1825]MBB6599931.1 tRNA (adenosine(37)-N6)-threonylcarbamoyltransferase complex dimerization subunit type 1 TsaB [Luteimonas sp. MC1825]QOC87640.1 tRNA (adenosine(37)-N6)-threonylcarbamoyltransferase complex dimerization subunit type 1 TsaB [Luteimonas sp. MC1825]